MTYRATEASFWHLAIPVALGLVLAFALLYGVFRAPRTALSTARLPRALLPVAGRICCCR